MLNHLRNQIDALDAQLITLLYERIQIVRQIGKIKQANDLPLFDEQREEKIHARWRKMAKQQGLSAPLIEEIMQLILQYSKIEMGAL